jgi:hypothetical protein
MQNITAIDPKDRAPVQSLATLAWAGTALSMNGASYIDRRGRGGSAALLAPYFTVFTSHPCLGSRAPHRPGSQERSGRGGIPLGHE